jgi:predicted anti-sigma-YlaC factor YlaD
MEIETTTCERARASVSLALDGELSELESLELDRHLLACDRCADFAARAAVVVDAIRSTPCELPRRSFEVAEKRRRTRPTIVIAAAVAVVVAASAGALVGTLRSSSSVAGPQQLRPAPPVALQFAVPVRDPRAHGADF